MHLTQRVAGVLTRYIYIYSATMSELTGCIPLDTIDSIHLNGLDSSTITVFKCHQKKKKERKRMSQRVTNYVGF